jgi:hypothetical protein
MSARPRRAEVAHQPGQGLAGRGLGGGGEVGVEGRRGRGVVPQIVLAEAQIDPSLEQMGGLTVPQGVDGGTLGDTARFERCPKGILHTVAGHGCGGRGHPEAATAWGGKEPERMAVGTPVLPQQRQGLGW